MEKASRPTMSSDVSALECSSPCLLCCTVCQYYTSICQYYTRVQNVSNASPTLQGFPLRTSLCGKNIYTIKNSLSNLSVVQKLRNTAFITKLLLDNTKSSSHFRRLSRTALLRCCCICSS